MMLTLFNALIWVYNHPWDVLVSLLAATAVLVLFLLFVNRVPISYNVLNLVVRWENTAFTGLSFALVIGLVTVMLGFVNGMYRLTQNSGVPGNLLILAEGATDESFSNLGFADLSDLENQSGIQREADGQPFVSRETYLVAVQPIDDPQTNRLKRRFLQVRGIENPERSARVHGMKLQPGGEWFSDAGVRDVEGQTGPSLIEVVLGNGIAGELGRDRSPEKLATARRADRLDVGDTFPVGNRTWIVVGVMEPSGATYGSEVWAKQSLIGPMFGKEGVTTLVARTQVDKALVELVLAGKPTPGMTSADLTPVATEKDANGVEKQPTPVPAQLISLSRRSRSLLEERVKSLGDDVGLPVPLDGIDSADAVALQDAAARRLKRFFGTEYEKASVAPQVEKDYFANLSATNLQFLGGIAVVTCIMGLGGVFGVMNTMFAAISQRTKDIGVLRLMGYKRWHILVSFLLESLVLAAVGGAVGCFFGKLFDGWEANSIISGTGGGGKFVILRLTVDSLIVVSGMLVSIGMGFVGGLIPAVTAMRLTALEALR